jgi:hypothetical protein
VLQAREGPWSRPCQGPPAVSIIDAGGAEAEFTGIEPVALDRAAAILLFTQPAVRTFSGRALPAKRVHVIRRTASGNESRGGLDAEDAVVRQAEDGGVSASGCFVRY